jgi:hypothetical protein
MGKMGHGYGSEFHLLRYLGYHRRDLNRAIEQQTGGTVLDWLEFSFGTRREFPHLDAEWKGLEFLDPDVQVRSAWAKFWPQTGNAPNWDAVGFMHFDSHVEHLLVEAKAHVSEIRSDCGAKPTGGRQRIKEALGETIKANGFSVEAEKWLSPYYQYANRLAHLHFLLQHNISSRLIFIYFLGDQWPDDSPDNRERVICPKTKADWEPHLREMYSHLGLKGASKLEPRVHSLFLDVCRNRVERGSNGI